MTRRQYPRIGRIDHQSRWAKLPANEGPRCIVCGAKATHKVHVEFDIFRGDDEVMRACIDHSVDVRALVSAWSARGALDSSASTVSPLITGPGQMNKENQNG